MTTLTSTVSEVIVIDAGVTDWKTLTAGISPDIPVILLPAGGDGVAALADALHGFENLAAVHLVSHGGTGYLQLGDHRLSSATLDAHSAALADIAGHLAPGADLLLYGCSVAAGATGAAFVESLSAALGQVDIAASDDRTGPLSLGGDWDLEFQSGEVESVLPFTVQGMQGVDHCLGCIYHGYYTTDPFLCGGGGGGGDTTPPTITGVSATTANGTYKIGDVIAITVTFSESVNVTGTPTIALNSGGTANYASGTGSNTLTFNYTVAASNAAADLNYNATNSLTLNGGTIKDAANNSATLTLPATGAGSSLGSQKNIVVDGVVPTVSSVSVPANGTYIAGQNLDFTVQFSEAVTVNTGGGTPYITLTLDTGGTVNAAYVSGSGTTNLVFRYTIASGNLDGNGVALGALSSNGGTIKDAAGNAAALTLDAVGSTSLVLVDGAAPSVSSINRVQASPTGATSVDYTVTFSESVSGVDASDFTLTSTGTADGTVVSVTQTSASVYVVTVNGITGDGTMRLDFKNSGTGVTDTAGNAVSSGYSSGQAYTIDGTGPAVTSVSVPANASYVAGQNLDFTVNFDENVTVDTTGGTPRIALALDTGGTVYASYLSGSGTSALTFRYTVASGDADTNGISVGALDANGGTLRDAAGNNATLTLNPVGSTASVLVDGIQPTVQQVNVPADATYIAGQNLDFTVSFSEAVTVNTGGGTPYLSLGLDTGGTVQASYVSGSGTTDLVFRYTVATGNADTNGVTVNSLSLNGGTIKDAAGNSAAVTMNAVGSTASVLVDGAGPSVSSINRVSASTTNGTSVDFTVTFSENVSGVDASDFTLTATGTASGSVASVTAVNGSTYTVKVDTLTGDGTVRLDFNNAGTGVTDIAGNAVSGGYTSGQTYTLDHIDPAVTSVMVPANGTYTSGQNLDFTVNFDENVTVDTTGGTPRVALALDTGGTVYASYLSGSGTSALTFRYTVAAGNADSNGITVGSLSLDGGTIKDAAGNNAATTLNSVGSTALVLVDSVAPVPQGNLTVPADGLYLTGQHLDFTITFDDSVTVTGTDSTLGLTIGSNARAAAYQSKTADSVTYRYTVQAGDNDADGIAIGAVTLNTTTIRDVAGNDAALSLTGHLPSTAAVLVDTAAPAVSGNIAVPADGAYRSGQVLAFTVSFDENVTVTGTDSTLAITVGSTVRQAAYASKTANSVTYQYTVVDGETDADGIAVGAVTLNTSTIRDAANNDADLTLTGHLLSTASVLVDTTAPTVASVSSDIANGTYKAGDVVAIKVTFNEAVSATGTPQLTLETGTTDRVANYGSGSGTGTLVFNYTVQAGDTSADLDYLSTAALSLNGGTIGDLAGNAATLTLPSPGAANSLGANKSIAIDTTAPAAPTALALSASSDTGVLDGRYTSTLAPTITGLAESGAQVKLYDTDGTTLLGTATAAGDGSWSITSGTNLSAGTHTLTAKASDAVGNASSASTALTVTIDTVAPQIVSAAVNSGTLTVSFDEKVYASDANGMTVKVDGITRAITSVSGSGTTALVLTLASGVSNGQTVLFDYDPGSGSSELKDAAANELATVTSRAVTNITPAPDEPATPPTSTSTIDGVTVEQKTTTNADGSTSQVVVIPVVTEARPELVGNNTVADIPLVKNTAGASLLSVQVPTGIGLEVSGTAAPKAAGNSLTDLIREIQAHTTSGSSDQNTLTGGGSGFLQDLPDSTPLLVQTIVPATSSTGVAPTEPLVIAGMPTSADKPMTALVIDVRGLPNSTAIQLQNVEFAAIIGSATVTGGAGSQTVYGDGSAQTIFLGADDDILHGGAGNDTVGSAGGNDQVFGDEGNDLVFGGEGNDVIDGGTGIDTVRLVGTGRSDYTLRVENGKLSVVHRNGGIDGSDTVSNVEKLVFTGADADMSARGTITRLYDALFDRAPDREGLDYWVRMSESGMSMHDIANQFLASLEAKALFGMMSNAAFVDSVYRTALGRAADDAGRAHWISVLDAGKDDRADVLLAFADSLEKRTLEKESGVALDFNRTDVAMLVRMYDTLFDRKPDQAGLNYWIAQSEDGMALRDIATCFIQSAQEKLILGNVNNSRFIEYLYETGLGRQGNTGEVTSWAAQLDAGTITRGDALLWIANSAEKIELTGVMSTSIDTVL
ncbi:DUF4347 domain-containing protein [Noviherbaspirillum denitrificans]|uniref:DUF4347 domain-containing protein n=1 Tax=Noviherbaspirillum denitrificans TaxID=1968433 RepID=A0A254TDF6_9BURK|nr:DUF4347 domain-containing protein [Noviherbaspirillum denitrificans]OWW20686.1 hypothetical protein AYR66_15530 [Noviherbaspirillum denitrificans]